MTTEPEFPEMDKLEAGVARLIRDLNRYRAALKEILEEAEDREDIKDGAFGPLPNEWMRVATICRRALGE